MAGTSHDLLRVLARRWYVLLIAAVIGGLVGLGLATTRSTRYRATARLLGHAVKGQQIDASLVNGSARVFQYVATDPDVVGPALRGAGLNTDLLKLSSVITATPSSDTPLLAIAATDANPDTAARLANTIAGAVSAYSRSLAARNGYQLDLLSAASKPTSPLGPGTMLFILAGVSLALLLAVFVLVISQTPEDEPEEVAELSALRPAVTSEPRTPVAAAVAARRPAPRDKGVAAAGEGNGAPSKVRPAASPRWKPTDDPPDVFTRGGDA